jgi:hypothetical protein
MSGTSGFQEVRSSTSRSPSNRLLHEQQHRSGTDTWQFIRNHNCIASSTTNRIKRRRVPDIYSNSGFALFNLLLLIGGASLLVLLVVGCDPPKYENTTTPQKVTLPSDSQSTHASGTTQNTTSKSISDTIQFNSSTSEIGVLVDGMFGGSFRNDYPPPSKNPLNVGTNDVRYGNFVSSPPGKKGEVVAFAKDKPPALIQGIIWSSTDDTFQLNFLNPVQIPVAIWIVTTPTITRTNQETILTFDLQIDMYTSPNGGQCTAANKIWKDEGHGILISCDPPKDATGPSIPVLGNDGTEMSANDYYLANPFQCNDYHLARLKAIGHKPNVINVYVVNAVIPEDESEGYQDYGTWCRDTDVIVMGSMTGQTVLAHELGHAFSLEHIDGMVPEFFDNTNVMHGVSSKRKYLTEGQTFRAFFNQGSAIMKTYAKGPGFTLTPRRPYCDNSSNTTNDACLPIHKRIWSDGPLWAPN